MGTCGISPLDKAGILVDALESRIAVENSSKSLLAFCRLLEKRPGIGSIAGRIKARLGEYVLSMDCNVMPGVSFFRPGHIHAAYLWLQTGSIAGQPHPH